MNNEEGIAMDITGKSASYQHVPAGEIHESPSRAIRLSGLDLSSADAFAYNLGMLASKSGLGWFISTIAAPMAGSYTANPIDETAGKQTKI